MTERSIGDVVVDRLVTNLGPPNDRRHVDESLHVLEFRDPGAPGVCTYVSLGLSDHELRQEDGLIRQELLFDCYDRFAGENLSFLVAHVAGQIAIRGQALAAFEALSIDPVLADLTGVEAVMGYAPIHHSEGIHVISTDPPTVVAWLLPISSSEARLAIDRGWEALADVFERKQPDFLDLERRAVL